MVYFIVKAGLSGVAQLLPFANQNGASKTCRTFMRSILLRQLTSRGTSLSYRSARWTSAFG